MSNMDTKKSFLLWWKFWVWIVTFIALMVLATKKEPVYIPQEISDTERKLIESKEYFYKECMWTGSIYLPWTKEYVDMEASCREWMDAIKNPNYKDILKK